MLSIPEKIRLTLESLGSTADEVAASLRSMGVKGRRGTGCDCPVANALKLHLPETAGQWHAHGYWVTAWHADCPGGQQVPVPQAVTAFIDCFDTRGYPDLDSEVAHA